MACNRKEEASVLDPHSAKTVSTMALEWTELWVKKIGWPRSAADLGHGGNFLSALSVCELCVCASSEC